MRTISHPMRMDSIGNVVSIDSLSARAAAELAGHVISCQQGERALSPAYGVPDADLHGISADQVAGAVALCEPEISAVDVHLSPLGRDRVRIAVDVEWSQL